MHEADADRVDARLPEVARRTPRARLVERSYFRAESSRRPPTSQTSSTGTMR